MRILLWAPHGAGRHYNGPGQAALGLYERLTAEHKVTVDLAHGRPGHESIPIFARQHYIAPLARSIPRQLMYLLQSARWLRKHVTNYDVVHALSAYEHSVSAAYVAEQHGVPAVVKITNARTNLCDKGGLRGMLGIARARRRRLSRLSGVIAMTDTIYEELDHYGIDKARVYCIPNGVDTVTYSPLHDTVIREQLRRQLRLPNAYIVLFSGAICRRKRPHLLINAIYCLPDTHLVLLGPETDRYYAKEIRELAARLGVERRVHWTGFQKEVSPYYRAADVFCLPSQNEGLSNSMLEAMSSGLPIVCTPTSGSREILSGHRVGVICEANGRAIANAISHIAGNHLEASAMATNGRQLMMSHYSLEETARQHLAMFRRLVKGKL